MQPALLLPLIWVMAAPSVVVARPQATSNAEGVTSIASGSSLVLPTATGTPDLTQINFSSLFGSDTPATTTAAIVTSTQQPDAAATTTTAPSPTCSDQTCEQSTTSSAGLTGPQIAGIAVGCFAALAIVGTLIFCALRRYTSKDNKFNRGRGITPSMLFTSVISRRNSNSRRSGYSFNTPQAAFGSEQPAQDMSSSYETKIQVPVDGPPRESMISHRSSNNPRLSKYNLLAQAFSAMRASYATNTSDVSQMTSIPRTTDNGNSLAPPPMMDHRAAAEAASHKYEGHAGMASSQTMVDQVGTTTPTRSGIELFPIPTHQLEPPSPVSPYTATSMDTPTTVPGKSLINSFYDTHAQRHSNYSDVSQFTTLSNCTSNAGALGDPSCTSPMGRMDDPPSAPRSSDQSATPQQQQQQQQTHQQQNTHQQPYDYF